MIKLRHLIKEDFLGTTQKGYEIYKNPKSVKRMDDDIKGVSVPSGDFYVVDYYNMIHADIEKYLKPFGVKIPSEIFFYMDKIAKGMKKGYIGWIRDGSTNKFYLSESVNVVMQDGGYDWNEYKKIIKQHITKIKAKNPGLKFIPEPPYW